MKSIKYKITFFYFDIKYVSNLKNMLKNNSTKKHDVKVAFQFWFFYVNSC